MKSVVLLSGGMDSAVLLAQAVEQHGAEQVAGLSFDYGQKHGRREMNCAYALAEHYGVTREVIRLSFMERLFRSALLRGGADIPLGHYTDPKQEATVVPGRNGIFVAIAAGYAESNGATEVLMGAHLGDAAVYPDCRAVWVERMGMVIWAQADRTIHLRAPFVMLHWRKADVVAEGNRLGVPWELTWSCYVGGEEPCGICGACVERNEVLPVEVAA